MTTTVEAPAPETPTTNEVELGSVLAWDNDRLVITDEPTLRQVQRKALSPSSAKSMASCRARWVIDRLLPDSDDLFAPAPLGTAGHLVLERMFLDEPTKRTHDDLMLQLLRLAEETFENAHDGNALAEKQRWIQAVYEKIKPIHDMEDVYGVNVHGTEMVVDDVEVAGVPFNGAIDRVDNVYDESGNFLGVRLIDYKTGKVPKNLKFGDDHGDQMRLYKLAFEAKYNINVVECWLYYTAFGKTRKVPIGKSNLSKTLKAFVAAWAAHNKSVEESAFSTKPGPLCGWCPAVNGCPSAVKDNGEAYVPRIDGIPSVEELGIYALRKITQPAVTEDAPAPESIYEIDADPVFAFAEDIDLHDLTAAAVTPTDQSSGVIESESVAPLNEVERTTRRGRKAQKENIMSNGIFAPELDKPWDDWQGTGLPPNTPDATALFGLVGFASEILAENGYPLDAAHLRGMTGLLTKVLADAEIALAGRLSWSSGLNTRLRGLLHSHIKTNPIPVGQGADIIEKWLANAADSLVLMSQTVVALYGRGVTADGMYDGSVFTKSNGPATFANAPQTQTDEPPF